MDQKTARKFLMLVNSDLYKDLQDYAEYRIRVQKDKAVSLLSMDDVRKMQGAIEELTRFKTFREEVIQAAKNPAN